MEIRRGRLIVVEGADAAGKSTQANRLHKHILAEGYDAELLDFPRYGQNIFADTVLAYLGGEFGNALEINPYLASFPYAGDRLKAAPHVKNGLERGVVFISNRYTFSSGGHQGAKIRNPKERRNYLEWLRKVEFSESGHNIPSPDLTLLLDVESNVASVLGKARTVTSGVEEDGHERDYSYQQRVLETFREIARSEPTWRIIDCMNEDKTRILPPVEIEAKIWTAIKDYLPPR